MYLSPPRPPTCSYATPELRLLTLPPPCRQGMHAQLEALLISSLSAAARIDCSPCPQNPSHTHTLHFSLCNNGPIALPSLCLQLSSADPAAVAAGILPVPPRECDIEGHVVASNDSLLQASASTPAPARAFQPHFSKPIFASARSQLDLLPPIHVAAFPRTPTSAHPALPRQRHVCLTWLRPAPPLPPRHQPALRRPVRLAVDASERRRLPPAAASVGAGG
jgi:hypothetical protein